MKKLLFLIAFALLIGASCCYGQSRVIRRQKNKTEQTQTQTRQKQQSEAKRRQKATAKRQQEVAEAKRRQEEEMKRQQEAAEAKRRQEEEAKRRQQEEEARKPKIETFTVNGVTFEMVRVDGGSYHMGNTQYNDEKSLHTETVGTFYIGKTEVTQRLWAAVMGSNPSYFKGENLPVEYVSWDDCREFVDSLSHITGRKFRLPTEVEWEYAARGGNKSNSYTYSGSNDVNRVAWYYKNSGQSTHPVAQKSANELGIYDMSGNVWEWTSDNYGISHSYPRGGSWTDSSTRCRVAVRYNDSSGFHSYNLGLRLAL